MSRHCRLFREWKVLGPNTTLCRPPWSHMRRELFAGRPSWSSDDPNAGKARVSFVGNAVAAAVAALRIEEMIFAAAAAARP